MIYCNFRPVIEQLIESINYEHFYNQMQNKRGILDRFRNKSKSIIVIINAFDIEIDVSDIRIVFYIDRFRNLLNYAQKNKRTKRNKLINKIIVILKKINDPKNNINSDSMLVESFIDNAICKRQILDEYLDNHVRIRYEKNEQTCEFLL